jgi:hypothetical protein
LRGRWKQNGSTDEAALKELATLSKAFARDPRAALAELGRSIGITPEQYAERFTSRDPSIVAHVQYEAALAERKRPPGPTAEVA